MLETLVTVIVIVILHAALKQEINKLKNTIDTITQELEESKVLIMTLQDELEEIKHEKTNSSDIEYDDVG